MILNYYFMEITIDWAKQLNCAVTVTDEKGIIIYMNEKAEKTFEKWGGKELLGKSMLNCHNSNSQSIIQRLISKSESNTYTIEKNGVKKMIYQTWYSNGIIGGLVEFSIEVPFDLPHFKRD
jgi:transcriptional regulator with PAS, ATPase and Fis domain